jgi:hypothetical protein
VSSWLAIYAEEFEDEGLDKLDRLDGTRHANTFVARAWKARRED